jgi:hypothetical protein
LLSIVDGSLHFSQQDAFRVGIALGESGPVKVRKVFELNA